MQLEKLIPTYLTLPIFHYDKLISSSSELYVEFYLEIISKNVWERIKQLPSILYLPWFLFSCTL